MTLGTVGSSDVAVILGVNRWGDPWELRSRLRGDVGYSTRDTKPQARGRFLESALLGWYAVTHQVQVLPGPDITQPGIPGPEPWMHTRHDGGVWDEGLRWAVEAKSTRLFDEDWGPVGTDQVPMYYLVQCIWHMACLDVPRCDLIAYATIADELREYTITRDLALERKVIAKARAWYDRYVVRGEAPPIHDPAAAKRAHARETRMDARPTMVAHDAEMDLVARLKEARAMAKSYGEHSARLEAELCLAMGEADTLETIGGTVLATWKDRKGTSRVDLNRLRADHPKLVESYTTTSEPGRTLRLVERKK